MLLQVTFKKMLKDIKKTYLSNNQMSFSANKKKL